MSKPITFVLAAAVIMISSCGSSPQPGEPGAVITVGERSVTAADLEQSLEQYRGDSVSVSVLRDNILARELFIRHATELGFDQDREVQRLMHERKREILQGEWLSYQLDMVESDQAAVREFWETMGTGVSYTALSLRDSMLMDSVETLVRGGEDLAQYAELYGLEHITRNSAGKIVIEDKNYANILDLDYLTDPSVGDVIGPFEVAVGWRILQIDSIWTYEPAPFEADSQRIASMLLARARENRKQFVEDSLKTAAGVTINLEAIELLASRATENAGAFTEFSEEEQNIIVVTWDGGSRDIYSVYRNVQGMPSYFPRWTNDHQWLEEYAVRLAMFDLEMNDAISLGLDTNPVVARRIMVKEMEVLLDHYYANVIEHRIVPDSAAVHQTYLEVREDFPVEESRVFNVLFLKDTESIEAAGEIMTAGDDMMQQTDRFEQFPPILLEGEDYLTIPLQRAMIPETDRDTLFGLATGEEAVVALSDTTALWFRLVEAIPEHIPEFDEIRDRVIVIAEQKAETEAIIGLVDSLEAVYHPYIDEEFFQAYYQPAETDSVSSAGDSLEVTDAL